MVLDPNKIQSLQDNINSLDVQKGMNTAVVSIQKDIFDIFTETKVRTSDKKSVIELEKGLEQSISRAQKSIEGKKETKNVNGISVKKIQENIKKLSQQKESLTKINQGIQQINNPARISPTILTSTQSIANLFTQDIVADATDINISVADKGISIKDDGDKHTLKMVDSGSGRQIEHDDIIIGKIDKVADISWKVNIFSDKLSSLGIKELQLPFVTSKTVGIENGGSSVIEKRKTWKINTEQLLDDNSSSGTPKSIDAHVDTIDQTIDQLFKLVNMADMRMRYNNIKTRWGTLKMHMQNFNRNQNINADSPLFASIFPALEHEVNEFKKELTNAMIDTQDKINRIKNSGIADLDKVKELEQELSDIGAKYKAIQDEFDTVHKELFDRIYKKTPKQLPPHNENPTIIPPVGGDNEPTVENEEPTTQITIDAHVMDKESLVKKSIEQDVLEEYQHKYEKRRWPQRLAMYTYARFMQNRRISKRLSLSKRYNDAIENDIKRQQRVGSSIGNFAYEYDLGVDAGKVKKTEIGSNDEVNTIANNYIKGVDNGGISREEAIAQFNNFFSNNSDYQVGMTGTDIMEQLDDTAFMVAVESYVKRSEQRTDDDYRAIQEKIREFYTNHPTAKLHGIHFNNPHVASKPEMDKLCDHILAYKSKSAVQSLQNITANVKLYKIEKDTVDLTQSKLREHNRTRVDTVLGVANAATFGMAGSTRGRVGLKMITGAGLAAGGVGSLGVVGGVAGMAAALQWMKTYRDYLTEAQKTHEDAMTMGTKELDKRIKELEDQIKKHTMFQKTLAFWGFGKHAIRTKQLNILHAVNDKMHQTGAIKPALVLIQEMQHSSRDRQGAAIAETLARLKMGRELDTNFISGTNRGLTEQERKDLLIQLREAGVQRAKKTGYGHLVPERNANEVKWRDFWSHLLAIPKNGMGGLYDRRCAELKKNFMGMKDDINKGRKKMARRDARTNLTTSATVAGVAAGVSAVASGMGRHSGTAGSTSSGPHNEYDLGKYDETLQPGTVTDKAAGWENSFSNGDKISFQGEAAVDAVNASKGTFGDISKEISEVTKLAGSFDSTTQDAVRDAMTTELAKVKAEAIRAGADAGNVQLTQQRWIDGVEEILTKLEAAGKTGVTIENIQFDPSTFNPIDIQASASAGSGISMQDVIDRSVAFNATIDGVPGARSRGDPLWVVWPGFSNTYAKPGDKNKHDDSWSNRTDELKEREKEDKKKEKEERKKEEQDDDYNRDFERKNGTGDPYLPTPPVEDKKKYWEDRRQDNGSKPFEEPDDTPQDHPYGEKDDKRGVSPRGREGSRTGSDVPRYFEHDYPHQPELLSPEQAAEKIIAAKVRGLPLGQMPFVSDSNYEMGRYTAQIEDAIQNKKYKLAVDLLSKVIRDENNYIQEQAREQGYDRLIKSSLKAVDTVFDELGVDHTDRAEVPDADHIHIIPGYLFHAQYNSYSKDTLGFVYNMNGHIFVNNEALEHGPNGDRTPEERKEMLLHIVNHEIIHGATTSNYHKKREEHNGQVKEGTEEYVFLRRLGAQMTRKINKNGQIYLEERGRALNEGLTESLNRYILEEKLGMTEKINVNAYEAERNIVDQLSNNFDIKKQDLYKFLINRKFGKDIIQKIYGNTVERTDTTGTTYKSYERPGYITLLMELMDMEHLQKSDKSLPLANNFVNNEPLTIKKSQSRNFHPSLINADGSLKDDILQAYPFITQA